jgi:hypothetical protein
MNAHTPVQEIEGEPLRFHVASRSGRSAYLVDLEEYGFNGKCGCCDFEFRKEPELSRGAEPSDQLRCRHIRSARAYFTDKMLRAVAAAMKGRNQNG